MAKYCKKCNTENNDDDTFCRKCGNRLWECYRNDSIAKSNPSLRTIGQIWCIITAFIWMFMLFFVNFNIIVKESTLTNIVVSQERMSAIELMQIDPLSVIGIIVIAMILFSFISILNPIISILNVVLYPLFIMLTIDIGVVEHGRVLDLTYFISNEGALSSFVFGFLVSSLTLVIYLVIRHAYLNNRIPSNNMLSAFWKEPEWYTLKKDH